MSFSFEDADRAIEGLREKLGRKANPELQEQFEAGLHPHLLSYDKNQEVKLSLPIIDKYLIGAGTYAHQPCNFYDIFAACRCVYMVQFLNSALDQLIRRRAVGLEERLERLTRETGHDAFDSVAFEIITAGRYAERRSVNHVEFIKESPPEKTPDLLVKVKRRESFVECKKLNRVQDFSVLIRNAVREHLNEVIASFRSEGVSVSAEVTFNCDPRTATRWLLVDAVRAALKSRETIIERDFTVSAVRLPKYQSDQYSLFPSPGFSWHRYGYRGRSDWFGIVNQWYGSVVRQANLPLPLQGGQSSWINELEWDSAVKWKIGSEEVLAKYRRFAFDGVFKGLQQIRNLGFNSSVHLWLESDHYVGGRKAALTDLFNRITAKNWDVFGWLLINETLLDVSPKGLFDMIEHAHMIHGPTAVGRHPLVSGLFASKIEGLTTGEFGVGTELPDIDA